MIFKRTVGARLKAKIATAEVVHIDASLIRAVVTSIGLVGGAGGTLRIGRRMFQPPRASTCLQMIEAIAKGKFRPTRLRAP
ncbi:hypothetical protein ABIC08_008328 [Bradyrhizobium sp. RT9b]